MSSNDGKQLLVFGLSFAQHDNRKMQQLLRHYDRLPENPGSRASLFVQLNKVAKDLMADEDAQDQIQQLTDWMTNGGDFPLGVAPAPTPAPANNPGYEARQAQGANNRDQLSVVQQRLERGRAFLAGRQDYRGPGRTLSGPQSTANQPNGQGVPSERPAPHLGRRFGRGRTIGGNWEEIDDEEGEENHEDAEEAMDTSMEEEDEDMEDPFGGFPLIPRHAGRRLVMPGRFPPWHNAFSGTGRTLDDPPEQGSATVGENEDGDDEGGPAAPTNVEGQAADQDIHTQRQQHDDDGDLDDEYYDERDPSTHQGEPDEGEEIECPICLEDYPRSRFPKHPTVTKYCDHPDKACLNCLDSSITAIIERGALHLLACPICPQRLSRRDIKEYANEGVYARYMYLKEQSEIPGHYISCTNPICGGSQPHESGDPKMVCNHCGFATCAKHRRPWHEGQTCNEFDLDDAQIERLEEEEATAKLLSSEATSICPKCGQGVTKSEGCDHMRCQCGQEWCYVVNNPPEPHNI